MTYLHGTSSPATTGCSTQVCRMGICLNRYLTFRGETSCFSHRVHVGCRMNSDLIIFDNCQCFTLQDSFNDNKEFSILKMPRMSLNQQPLYYHSVVFVTDLEWTNLMTIQWMIFVSNLMFWHSSYVLLFMPTDCDPCNAVHTLHYPVAPSEGFRKQFTKGIYILNTNIFFTLCSAIR